MKLTRALLRGISLRDLFFASQDPSIRIATSPFGEVENGGTAFVGRYGSPYAKGVHIAQPSPLARFGRSHSKGTVLVSIGGKLKFMPRAAAENYAKGRRGGRMAVAPTGGRRRGGEELGF